MRINFEEARIYVRPGSTDLRKGVSGLCSIIVNEMNTQDRAVQLQHPCEKEIRGLCEGDEIIDRTGSRETVRKDF